MSRSARCCRRPESAQGTFSTLETHAFRPTSKLGHEGREAWERHQRRLPDTEAVRLYRSLEAPYVDKGDYLCSTGLAHHLLQTRTCGATEFLLCEESPDSLDLLRTAFPDATILDNNKSLLDNVSSWSRRYNTVIALIDPFTFNDIINVLEPWLGAFYNVVNPNGALISLVFSHSPTGVPWPQATESSAKLAGSLAEIPYCLAVYTNPIGLSLVQDQMTSLGWSVTA